MSLPNVKRIVVFANQIIGEWVVDFLVSHSKDCELVAIYLVDDKTEINSKIVKKFSESDGVRLIIGKDEVTSAAHLNWLASAHIDFAVTVYWPWLLPAEYLRCVADSVNFHPAMLPKNRGWYPHVHNIIDGSEAGVTLHRLAEKADAGEIWAQKSVDVLATDTAKDLHGRLQGSMFELFTSTWPKILRGEINPQAQDDSAATYNKKSDLDSIDVLNLEVHDSLRNFINLLRARTFGDKGYSYFLENGRKIYVSIKLDFE
jgi:methionyl-tRNA formyltransferase